MINGFSGIDLVRTRDKKAALFWSVEHAPSYWNRVGLNPEPSRIFLPTGLVLIESAYRANVPEVGHSRLIEVAMQLGT